MGLRRRLPVSAVFLALLAPVACFPSIDFVGEDAGRAAASDAGGAGDSTVIPGPPSDAGAPDDAHASAPDAAFPRTPVLDTFDRADAETLGNGWDEYQVGIAGNSAVFKPSVTDPSGGLARWGEAFGSDQEVYATIKRFPTASGGELALFAKFASVSTQGDCYGWDYYVLVNFKLGGSGAYVEWCKPTDAGGKRDGADISTPWANGDRIGLRVLATNHAEVYRNGLRVADVPLTDWPYANAGGQIGLSFSRAGDATMDDFGGGTITPP